MREGVGQTEGKGERGWDRQRGKERGGGADREERRERGWGRQRGKERGGGTDRGERRGGVGQTEGKGESKPGSYLGGSSSRRE